MKAVVFFTLSIIVLGVKNLAIFDLNDNVALMQELQQAYAGANIFYVKLDITNRDNIEAAFKEAVVKMGHFDVVVNGSGLMNDRLVDLTIKINLAWPTVKKSFELYPSANNVHTISDCMHVASEPGDYVFKKLPHLLVNNINMNSQSNRETNILDVEDSMAVCGLYVIGEPDTIVEITMKHYDVNCETGGLMAFVDGWELNGEYFPGIRDHHRPLEDRVSEFCNSYKQWSRIANKKFFRSSQNAALLQYRIPVRGSFIANVRFHKITQPCNVLVQDTAAVYDMANFGHRRNCTLSAIFPAAVSLANLKIGGKSVRQEKANYDCAIYEDRLEIGGTSGLDSATMEKSSDVCGYAEDQGPEQGIFCGITTIRLISTGRYQNQASIVIRKADENDLDIATLICAL